MSNLSDFIINESGWLVGYKGADKEVTVPECVTGLDAWAFSANPDIESITVPGSVKTVSFKSIVGLDNLKRLTFLEGVEKIDSIAVSMCGSLEEVSIPDSVLDVDVDWVYECPNIKYSYDGEVKYLGNAANPYVLLIKGDGSLTEYEVKAGAKIVLDKAFHGAQSLERVSFPEGLRKIAFSAFGYCYKLAEVSFGEGLAEIESCAFTMTGIEEAYLPDSIKKIGWRAFACSLERIRIPTTVEKVEKDSFGYGKKEYNEYEGCRYIGCEENPYVILAEVVDKDAESFKIHKNTILIGSCAFSDCVKLRGIELPEGIVGIEDSAFKNCYRLERVILPESLKSIGDSAFFSCLNLREINFPKGRISIGSHAFCLCQSLEDIVLEDASVGDNAFTECTALQTVKVGEKCNLWGDYIFAWSFRLKKAILAEKFRDRLGEETFEDCIDVEIEYI